MKKLLLLAMLFSATAISQTNESKTLSKTVEVNDELAFTYCVYGDKIYSRNSVIKMSDEKNYFCYQQSDNKELRWKILDKGTVMQ